MPHQRPSDTLSLIFIDDGEGHLGLSGFHDDVTPTAGDHPFAVFPHHCDQGDVIDKINVDEEGISFSLNSRLTAKKRR